jgi:hypothetical protein
MNSTADEHTAPAAPVAGSAPVSPTSPALPPGQTYYRPPKSPGLAVLLSILLPGVGQIYNGQTAKAFVFLFGWVGSIYGAAQIDPMPFAFLIPFVYLYNLIDAWRGATLINLRAAGGQPPEQDDSESPAWGATLVALGLLLLLNNLGWLRLSALRDYWPALLIVVGGLFVYRSLSQRKDKEEGEGRGGEPAETR